MKWSTLIPYQKLFICAVGLMLIYAISSRILGIWLDPEEINFKKILRFVIGLFFIGTVLALYILPDKRKNTSATQRK